MPANVTLDLWTFDVGLPASTPDEIVDAIRLRVWESWDSGADLVVFPEYCWMALAPLIGEHDDEQAALRNVATIFWAEIFPKLTEELSRQEKTVVLGTCPWLDSATGEFRNRAPIISSGRILHQDKIRLTPWESAFGGGKVIHLWNASGLTCAVLICLDIEFPELSAALRGRGVDLILCPSATENILGVERVDRCASARAVELGCHVGVAHLVGSSLSSLIDHNIGRVAVYHPSQSGFLGQARWEEGEIVEDGFHRLRTKINPNKLVQMRALTNETNPSLQSSGKSFQQFSVQVV